MKSGFRFSLIVGGKRRKDVWILAVLGFGLDFLDGEPLAVA